MDTLQPEHGHAACGLLRVGSVDVEAQFLASGLSCMWQ
jgi:hypothetical protein